MDPERPVLGASASSFLVAAVEEELLVVHIAAVVGAQCVTTHWLRHTTLTWVERNSGYGIGRACAGHIDSTGPATTTYIKPTCKPSPPPSPLSPARSHHSRPPSTNSAPRCDATMNVNVDTP